MNEWLTTVMAEPAVLVTVAIVEGSGPREPGARMLVTAGGQVDTIGGGHLEMCAVDVGRSMLNSTAKAGEGVHARLERYALGPSLGQCCGGVVHLAFELIDSALADVMGSLRKRWREDSWRLSAIDGTPVSLLLDASGAVIAGTGTGAASGPRSDSDSDFGGAAIFGPAYPSVDHQRGTHILRDTAGRRWLADPCLAPRAHLLLFGAGHVGAAIVRMLGELPCTVSWIDEREDMFPATIPANVTIEATDAPEALVAAAPAGASYLVMTHSHALDQRLSEAILARADVGWFGLIGSKTKRVQFERRMAARGLPEERIAAMVCPIGIAGITNKLPAAIAASVCAQLLMVWEVQQIAALETDARDGQTPNAPVRLVASR
ncbi:MULTISPECIES: xanthine dehydrogenase accessory protein XdhC [unclassified Duganella]|uniref:xanthine dehydrogenase accessory protein XdhC n=1 Tax=unclassified Duganella TaxID=2636909 RepID=UPI000E34DD39|nr:MULTISPECIES: xanthine dehydrogenase accessory protein XdhC [unclassified Duganella]RFP10876.1 xanthine dehydrogenase accessory protein XdhC [Duganella sp. BJB475]RFP27096.1 xanthine dehydrogenase accessory protein XdhC [Duganella sp. BJB476]